MKLEQDMIDKLNSAGVDSALVEAVTAKATESDDTETNELKGQLKTLRAEKASLTENKAKLLTRAETAETKLGEIEASNLTGDEKFQRQIDELKTSLDASNQAIIDKDKAILAKDRDNAILKMTSTFKTVDGVDRGMFENGARSVLADVEDLSSDDAQTKLKSFAEANSALILSDKKSGSGGKGGGLSGGGDDKPKTIADAVGSAWQ